MDSSTSTLWRQLPQLQTAAHSFLVSLPYMVLRFVKSHRHQYWSHTKLPSLLRGYWWSEFFPHTFLCNLSPYPDNAACMGSWWIGLSNHCSSSTIIFPEVRVPSIVSMSIFFPSFRAFFCVVEGSRIILCFIPLNTTFYLIIFIYIYEKKVNCLFFFNCLMMLLQSRVFWKISTPSFYGWFKIVF